MKVLTGLVVSKKMQKTATVEVERVVRHRVYKKRVKRTKKYHVHDELGSLVGQKVRFVESRPFSKTKKWKIVEILSEVGKKTKGKVGKSEVGVRKKRTILNR